MKPNERKKHRSTTLSAESLRAQSKIVDSQRTAVSNARNVLYDLAVAAMPFDPWGPGPDSIEESRSIIAKIREWHAPLAAAYGWHGRHGEQLGFNEGSLLAAIFGGKSDEPTISSDAAPPMLIEFIGQPSEKKRHAMGNQVRWLSNERLLQSSEFGGLNWDEVRGLALRSRYLALELVRWAGAAIKRIDSLMLPRITVTEGPSRSHIASVLMAGVTRDRKIQDMQLDAVMKLAEMKSVNFEEQWRRSKLIDAIPELNGLILTDDARTGKAWYRLDPRMKGRIKRA